MSFCFDEDYAFYIVLKKWDVDTKTLIDLGFTDLAKQILLKIKDKEIVGHNIIFDCQMVETCYGIRLIDSVHTDTMILAHLLDENRRVGLKELGSDIFGEDAAAESLEVKASVERNGGAITKKGYEMYKADYQILAKYGAKDAWLTYKLFLHLVPELFEQKLDDFFYNDESMPLLRGPTYDMNTVGLKVDTKKLLELKKTLEAECMEAKAFIYREIDSHIKTKYPGTSKSTTFNIGSNQQLAWLLFGEMDLEFSTLTDSGKEACRALGLPLPYTNKARADFIRNCSEREGTMMCPEAKVNGKIVKSKNFKAPWAYISCDHDALVKLAPKRKWIEKLLEYNKKSKLLSTYIKGIEEKTQYGIIRPSFLQHGTTSGRYSSRDPNFQNLPRDDKRIKSCLVSRPERVFVGADYSQLEPRVFAYFSGDERLLSAFKGTDDFYSVIGMAVYNKTDCTPQKEGSPDAFGVKYKKLRDLSKVIALASTYGATANQLAPTTGKSIQDTQQDIDNYFESFPGVKEMMNNSHKLAIAQGYVENLFGRKRRLPDAPSIPKIYKRANHSDLPYQARQILNLAVNHRIQSTGASICNRSMIKFHSDIKTLGIEDCKIVMQVHDEIIVECKETDAELVSNVLRNAMETAVILPTIDLEAIPKIANNLADLK
jgi:DNA polymerase I-like protein with 3'-5' exonuclease and polymerase domains